MHSISLRKVFAYVLIAAGFGALWIGLAQPASAGEQRSHVCTAENSTVVTQCARVEVSPQVDVPELGVGDVVDDVTDTVTDLVGDLL